jgi:hypothetical protein
MSYFGLVEDNVDVLFWTVCRNRWEEENVAAYFGVYFRIKLIEDNVDRIYMC